MQVWKCDICGTTEPLSIRTLVAHNPNVRDDQPMNDKTYYPLKYVRHVDLCGDCLAALERRIAIDIDEMKRSQP